MRSDFSTFLVFVLMSFFNTFSGDWAGEVLFVCFWSFFYMFAQYRQCSTSLSADGSNQSAINKNSQQQCSDHYLYVMLSFLPLDRSRKTVVVCCCFSTHLSPIHVCPINKVQITPTAYTVVPWYTTVQDITLLLQDSTLHYYYRTGHYTTTTVQDITLTTTGQDITLLLQDRTLHYYYRTGHYTTTTGQDITLLLQDRTLHYYYRTGHYTTTTGQDITVMI